VHQTRIAADKESGALDECRDHFKRQIASNRADAAIRGGDDPFDCVLVCRPLEHQYVRTMVGSQPARQFPKPLGRP
jgi:hypothetical protein